MRILRHLPFYFPAHQFHRNPLFRWSMGLSLVATISCLLLLLWAWPKLPPVVPLFYSLPWGESQLASAGALLTLTGAIFLFYILNFLWALLLPPMYIYFTRILLVGATTILFLGLTTIVQIILLIT